MCGGHFWQEIYYGIFTVEFYYNPWPVYVRNA